MISMEIRALGNFITKLSRRRSVSARCESLPKKYLALNSFSRDLEKSRKELIWIGRKYEINNKTLRDLHATDFQLICLQLRKNLFIAQTIRKSTLQRRLNKLK